LQRASRTPARSQDHPPTSKLFAGTSGWAYPSWKPGFYPKDVRAKDFLAYYASQLNSVEVNYTFRLLPKAEQLEGWMAAVPKTFRFTFKAPQSITHFKRLRDCEDAVLAFLDAIEPVRKAKQLGVLLFQLPPNFKADNDRLAAFLKLRAFKRDGLRLSFEFRHESWLTDANFDLMRSQDAALCVADGDELQVPDITTASFRSYRMRKSGGYTDSEIEEAAGRLSKIVPAGDTFVYLRHEEQPAGPLSAVHLLQSFSTLEEKEAH